MIQMPMQDNCEDDLVIFEMLAENIKIKLDNIITNNHQYKTDYYRFNRKKFLLSYCFDTNNASNEYEINAYLDEIKKLSAHKDYNSCFDKANRLISSTITYVTFKSNKLLEKLKYNNQPNHAQIILNTNQNNDAQNSQANTWQSGQPISLSGPASAQNTIGINLNNIIDNDNVRFYRNESNSQLPVEANNYYERDVSGVGGGGEGPGANNVNRFYDDEESTEYNLAVNAAVQFTIDNRDLNANSIQQFYDFQSGQTPNIQGNNKRGDTNDNATSGQKRRSQNRSTQGEKRFVCEHCNKEFKLKHHLTRHLRQHTGEKPFVCEFCGRSFTDESNFNLHMKTRHGDPELLKWPCETCQKRFASKSGLDYHQASHTNEKNFQCELCGKSFSRKESLLRHSRIHTNPDDRPFSCEYCDKKFRATGNLREHMKTHTLTKPYECEICKKKFYDRSKLNDHKQIHDDTEKFECTICNIKFTTIFKYRNHNRKHKNNLINETNKEIAENGDDDDDEEEEEEEDYDDEDDMVDEISENKIKSEPESMSESEDDEDNKSSISKKTLDVKIRKVKLSFSKK